ncbi:MAG: ribosomal-processing cysteine protease Prp [Ruminococcaceae bacterium]|nr:ribosomal-processing cysteine protease Prp [Oscillospiraceae bacterium]
MTQVFYEHTPPFTEFTVAGHCNAGKINGIDLCCCAVSMLVFTVMESLSAMKLKNFKSSYSGGWCHIRFENSSEDADKAKTVLSAIMKGFGLLEKTYPSNIKISKPQKGGMNNE